MAPRFNKRRLGDNLAQVATNAKIGSGGLSGGIYRNSECRASVWAGWTWETRGRVRMALTAGAASGYAGRAVQPLVLPSVAFDVTKTTAVRFSYLPKVHAAGAHGAHLSVEWRNF
jgi:hypothetical protein